MITEKRKARIKELLDMKVNRILEELGTSNIDEGIKILNGKNGNTTNAV
tara:strand:+ start:662 stop:808 length:147 start_codon:yes stop_codon:yes gene_type:complete